MKKLKTVTIWSLLSFLLLSNILKISYYKRIFSSDVYYGGDIDRALNISGTVLGFLFFIFYLVLGIMALVAADKAARDRAYSLLRFVFVMQSLINLPLTIIQTWTFAKYTFADPASAFSVLFWNALWLTLVILLIICKPEKQIQKVDLQNYDMVAFTSTGHRFVHHLLDVLFLIPVWLFALQLMMLDRFGSDLTELAVRFVFGTTYLLYCFLSEAIFKQTLGKMATRSCLVSDGVNLSTGRILRRTLARLIPFDAFSFLFGAKWHDRASATAVVYVDSWEKAFEEKQEA
jgi:hypothetical protein